MHRLNSFGAEAATDSITLFVSCRVSKFVADANFGLLATTAHLDVPSVSMEVGLPGQQAGTRSLDPDTLYLQTGPPNLTFKGRFDGLVSVKPGVLLYLQRDKQSFPPLPPRVAWQPFLERKTALNQAAMDIGEISVQLSRELKVQASAKASGSSSSSSSAKSRLVLSSITQVSFKAWEVILKEGAVSTHSTVELGNVRVKLSTVAIPILSEASTQVSTVLASALAPPQSADDDAGLHAPVREGNGSSIAADALTRRAIEAVGDLKVKVESLDSSIIHEASNRTASVSSSYLQTRLRVTKPVPPRDERSAAGSIWRDLWVHLGSLVVSQSRSSDWSDVSQDATASAAATAPGRARAGGAVARAEDGGGSASGRGGKEQVEGDGGMPLGDPLAEAEAGRQW